MRVTPKIEVNDAFKEHMIGNIPKIERKYSKGNFIDNPLKENFTDNTSFHNLGIGAPSSLFNAYDSAGPTLTITFGPSQLS